ncbi:MAG: hypothetical protein KKH75_03060 [Actinobacteria bacterium]|nr:hypothetical protein [Actinomycetota bacterium]
MTSSPSTGWPRGRVQWILGAVVLLVVGAIVGLVLGSIWIGLLLAAAVSIGWLIAYESWRGRKVGLDDPDDDGAVL